MSKHAEFVLPMQWRNGFIVPVDRVDEGIEEPS